MSTQSSATASIDTGGRKKRPRIAEQDRQRAARACDGCRFVKEKCRGGVPCQRCIRRERNCTYSDSGKASRQQPTVSHDEGRVQLLETIVTHFLGDVPLDTLGLQRIVEKLQKRQDQPSYEHGNLAIGEESFTVKAISSSTANYSGEFSHWSFSQRIRRRIDEQSGQINSDVSRRLGVDFEKDLIDREHWRASQLHLPGPNTRTALECLPPRPIADFLAQVFLKHGQINHFFVQGAWLQAKLQQCYELSFESTVEDSAWICSILMVLAVGTQFAHLEDGTSGISRDRHQKSMDEEVTSEDCIGVTFYHAACKLIPDVIIDASVESAQAFLLLAAYLLPQDAQGLGYTYLGLSVKMCVQNGMHRRQSDPNQGTEYIELRRRLWWAACTLDKRISILHGRPATVVHSDVDADLPTDLPDFQEPSGHAGFHNMTALIKLTDYLGEISCVINLLRRCPKSLQTEYLGRLLNLREKMHCWWQTLPEKIACRDLRPSGSLFRPNVHLKMSLHLNQIYMGRPFLFRQSLVVTPDSPSRPGQEDPQWAVLAKDCVDGALAIIDLCRCLYDYADLARASYTEFSSCRAALLVIVAQSLNEQCDRLQSAFTQGLVIIRTIMIGNDSAKAEVSVIEALANATRRLTSGRHNISQDRPESPVLTYTSFKDWASSAAEGRQGSRESMNTRTPPSQDTILRGGLGGRDLFADLTDFDLNQLLASFPLEQGGFGPLP